MYAKSKALAFAATVLMSTTAMAGDGFDSDDPFDFMDKDRWMLRMRTIMVAPDESSSTNIGGEAHAGDAIVPEIDVTYFFTKNIAAELIAATAQHDMSAANTSLGNLDLGHVWIVPPVLTLQYHFNPDGQFRPYVGAGVNYIFYYNEDSGVVNDIDYDNGPGLALQAGIDIGINEKWAVNFDVKKVWHNVDVSMNSGAVTADVDLDPWIFGAGLAYRF